MSVPQHMPQPTRRLLHTCRAWLLPWCLLLVLNIGPFQPITHASVFNPGDILAGKAIADTCASCHGQDGNSDNPAWPKIAGLDPSYALKQLNAYAEGDQGCRPNVLMAAAVRGLNQQDLANLAAYYASKPMSAGYAEPEPLTRGEQLYRAGDRKRQITACMACHGPRGRGLASAMTPPIAGQQADYLAAQLLAYRDNKRCTDTHKIMRTLAARLTDDDIRAVANYMQGLY